MKYPTIKYSILSYEETGLISYPFGNCTPVFGTNSNSK